MSSSLSPLWRRMKNATPVCNALEPPDPSNHLGLDGRGTIHLERLEIVGRGRLHLGWRRPDAGAERGLAADEIGPRWLIKHRTQAIRKSGPGSVGTIGGCADGCI